MTGPLGLWRSLESANATLGTVIESKQVMDLPLNGRNFTQLLPSRRV